MVTQQKKDVNHVFLIPRLLTIVTVYSSFSSTLIRGEYKIRLSGVGSMILIFMSSHWFYSAITVNELFFALTHLPLPQGTTILNITATNLILSFIPLSAKQVIKSSSLYLLSTLPPEPLDLVTSLDLDVPSQSLLSFLFWHSDSLHFIL